jgi:hypothetical protein
MVKEEIGLFITSERTIVRLKDVGEASSMCCLFDYVSSA